MPSTAAAAVDLWSKAYVSYAQSAIAGGTVPAGLVPVPIPGPFFAAFGGTLSAMWLAVRWAGPGLVGQTALVPDLASQLAALGTGLLGSRDPERALSAISDALHTYTLGVTVTVVTAAGVSSAATLL